MIYILTASIASIYYLLSVIFLSYFGKRNIYFIISLIVAVVAHFLALFFLENILNNLNVMNILSLVSLLMVFVASAILLLRKDNITISVTALIAAICIWGSVIFVGERVIKTTWKMDIHIVFSIISYVAFAFGALYASLLLIQVMRLRKGVGISKINLPLDYIENTMIHFAIAGILSLTVSLISGLLFVDSFIGQHVAHKTVFSFISWIVMFIFLLRYFKSGMTGKSAGIWMLTGFALLLLAYFGSGFIIQVLLKK